MLMARERTGEQVDVDLLPHPGSRMRPQSKTAAKHEQYVIWFKLKSNGLTLKDISRITGTPVSTVGYGVGRAPGLIRRALLARSRPPAHLNPVFGSLPYTKDRERSQGEPCEFCDSAARIPAASNDVCMYCLRAAAAVDERLAEELARLAVLEARAAANRRATEPGRKTA
jgi:hypothetical protein